MRALLLLAASALLSTSLAAECKIDAVNRFDCHPEDNSTETVCQARGCCWDDTSNRPLSPSGLTTPKCFYPEDYVGYQVDIMSEYNDSNIFTLTRETPSNISEDIQIIQLEIIEQTDDIIRLSFRDAKQPRWEPPLPKIPEPKTTGNQSYDVMVDQNTKVLKVVRKQSGKKGTTIVEFNLATLVYTNHFIQISSKLPSQVVYGLGEHKGSLRRSTDYSKFSYYNQDRQQPEYHARLYGTHPLYINIESDGQTNGVWLFNSNALDVILQPTPAVTYRTIGGILDFFVFTGPTPAEVIKQYQQMVGKPKMIPYWSLGYHLCRFGYENVEQTKETLQNNLDAGVRIDTQWHDIDYMHERNDFTIDEVNYKDLGAFVKELHGQGRHYVMIVDPAVSGSETNGTYPPYDRGLEYDVFVKDLKGNVVQARVWNLKSSVFPDFTHPNASAYWTEMFSDFYKLVEYDGAWIDMNEPSNLEDGHLKEGCPDDFPQIYTPGVETLQNKTLCITDQHAWSSHYDTHNMYGFTEAIATYNALTAVRPNKRPFIISRSTFSGSGFYTGHWTGDVWSTWEDLKDSVPGFLEFSFYGIPMVGVDICGFHGNATDDLCTRWTTLGAFYPFARNHNDIKFRLQDPAAMGGKVLAATNTAFYWRYKLLPHLYTLFHRAHVEGETVARPLFFEYPADKNVYDNDEQFLWGDSLMVVPALHEDQTTINAYFPEGIWYDIQNRTSTVVATRNGRFIPLTAYEDTINFFVKGGKSVFFQEPGNTTTDSRMNPYGVYVFLDQRSQSSGEIYIDDGESTDVLEKGTYSLATLTASDKEVKIKKSEGSGFAEVPELNLMHIYGVKSKPSSVHINSGNLANFAFDASRSLLSIYNINSAVDDTVVSLEY